MGRVVGMAVVDEWSRGRPWLLDGLLATAIAALVLPVGVEAVLDGGWSTAARAVVIGALVVGHAVVALRRTMPRLVFVVVAAMSLLLVLLPDLGGATAQVYDGPLPPVVLPSVVLFPLALYTVAASCSPATALRALGVAILGTVMALGRLWFSDAVAGSNGGASDAAATTVSWPILVLVSTLSAVLAPWALGRFRRVRTQYIAALEERAAREEEDRRRHAAEALRDERARIARELHDIVSHSLSVMVSQAEGGRMMAGRDPTVAVNVLETIARSGQDAMHGMRGMLDALDPLATSPQEPPQPALVDLPALVERVRSSGVVVHQRERGDPRPLTRAGELGAYRVVQESLTNVLKHAGSGATVDLALQWDDDALDIRVRNDDAIESVAQNASGRGLIGMKARLQLLGGTLAARRTDDGFAVDARIPYAAATPEQEKP